VLTARPLSDGITPGSPSACLRIVIRRVAENVIVAMHGELTATSAAGINHLLADLIRDQGNLHLVIDADEVTAVDGQGLEVLLQAKVLALRCGAALTVRNAPESVRKALEAREAERSS
jgi:anti-anti-sigma factor